MKNNVFVEFLSIAELSNASGFNQVAGQMPSGYG